MTDGTNISEFRIGQALVQLSHGVESQFNSRSRGRFIAGELGSLLALACLFMVTAFTGFVAI